MSAVTPLLNVSLVIRIHKRSGKAVLIPLKTFRMHKRSGKAVLIPLKT